MTYLDLLVAMAGLMLFAVVAGAASMRATEKDNRIRCGSNLRQIGQAMRQYAIDDVRGGAYPRTRYNVSLKEYRWATPYANDPALTGHPDAHPFDKAKGKNLPDENDVTAPLFHLLRESDLTTQAFVCPSSDVTPMAFPEGEDKSFYTNWTGEEALAKHLSYSVQNMYGDVDAIRSGFVWTDSLGSTIAIMADMNPGDDVLLSLTPDDAVEQLRKGNSLNHGRDGQAVLYADGSVRFVMTPFVGSGDDNIYTFIDEVPADGDLSRAKAGGIIGSPAMQRDSALVPTAKAIGQTVTPRTPAEMERDRKDEIDNERARAGEAAAQSLEDFARQSMVPDDAWKSLEQTAAELRKLAEAADDPAVAKAANELAQQYDELAAVYAKMGNAAKDLDAALGN